MIKQQATSSFKNREPKVSIFTAEEKRIRQLYGPKDNLTYKIKLNDEILDHDIKGSPRQLNNLTSKAVSKSPGRLHLGLTLEETLEQQLIKETIKRSNQIAEWIGLKKALALGPG